MINIRGTSYSRKHLSLEDCISCEEYWNFSHHETALEDYSVSIDYVLKETNSTEVFFVGYSMATAQYLMLLSEKPEYNKKIKGAFLLGPRYFWMSRQYVFNIFVLIQSISNCCLKANFYFLKVCLENIIPIH